MATWGLPTFFRATWACWGLLAYLNTQLHTSTRQYKIKNLYTSVDCAIIYTCVANTGHTTIYIYGDTYMTYKQLECFIRCNWSCYTTIHNILAHVDRCAVLEDAHDMLSDVLDDHDDLDAADRVQIIHDMNFNALLNESIDDDAFNDTAAVQRFITDFTERVKSIILATVRLSMIDELALIDDQLLDY